MNRRIFLNFIVIVFILCSVISLSCKAQGRAQIMSADKTTCTVKNIGSAGEIRVNFYQIDLHQYYTFKQWVIFPLAQDEEFTLQFGLIKDPSQVGHNFYYINGQLPEGAHGGSNKEQFRISTDGKNMLITDFGSIYKETESSYFYETTDRYSISGCILGFRVQ